MEEVAVNKGRNAYGHPSQGLEGGGEKEEGRREEAVAGSPGQAS